MVASFAGAFAGGLAGTMAVVGVVLAFLWWRARPTAHDQL